MKHFICLLTLLLLCCSLMACAEDIMEKGRPTASPASAPTNEIEDQGNAPSSAGSRNEVIESTTSNVVIVSNQNNAVITPVADPLAELKPLWLSKNQYYYQQLSAQHKQAWEVVIRNVLLYPNQSPVSPRDTRRQALGPMIKLDNPRIFWIDWIDTNGRLRYETGVVAHMGALQFPQGQTLASLQETFLAAISKAVAQIEKSLPANASSRDTVKAIHDWLCKNNSYNSQQTTSHKKDSDPVAFAYLAAHSAYSAIIPGDAYEPVCEGYASAFQILCEEFGIEALHISGGTKEIPSHAWNYVKLDNGQWYLVDVDADDLAASYNHNRFLLDAAASARYGYTADPYVGSGVNPSNGYSEGAAFTLPALAK